MSLEIGDEVWVTFYKKPYRAVLVRSMNSFGDFQVRYAKNVPRFYHTKFHRNFLRLLTPLEKLAGAAE